MGGPFSTDGFVDEALCPECLLPYGKCLCSRKATRTSELPLHCFVCGGMLFSLLDKALLRQSTCKPGEKGDRRRAERDFRKRRTAAGTFG